MSLLFLALPFKGLSASIPHVWNVPAENHNFVGREELLEGIATLFKNAPLKVAVLYGPSGIGKSQIAKKYAYQNYASYDVVWWFKGNQYLESQFEEFALEMGAFLNLDIENKIKTFGHSRLINMIKGAIRRKRLKCLIIFDNAQAYHDIEPYIPFSHDKGVHIIITTQNANFSNDGVQVKPFQRKESILYIHRFLPSEPKEYQNKLAKHLGDCPISIASAVDHVNDYPGMTIDDFLLQHNIEITASPELLKNAAEKLGGSIDGYPTDLAGTITMNLKELKRNSPEALTLVNFLSLLNPDEIALSDIKTWLKIRKSNTNKLELLNHLKRYSFIEITTLKNKKKVYISMHDLRQKIINAAIPIDEKMKLIDECVYVLQKPFSGRSDQVVENILKTTTPLSHAVKLSDEADKIDYHSDALTALRVKIFDTLLCGVRDLKQAEIMNTHLQKDLKQGIDLSRKNQILYHINLSVFSVMHNLDYEKALTYGDQAATLLEEEDKMYEEKMRLIANMIQYFVLTGNLDKCEDLLKKGELLLSLSQSAAYNALFIFATSMYLIDKGDFQKTIDLIVKHNALFEKLDFYPSIRFYILNQLAEAFLKQGKNEECLKILELSEKEGLEFYDNTKNTFFANLNVLKAGCNFLKPGPHDFQELGRLLQNSLKIYDELFSSKNDNRVEAFAHLMLGKLYHLSTKYNQAKKHYLISEQIFEKALKNIKIDDVSELYKMLAILGIDSQDELLIHTYSKKQLDTFGTYHPKTIEISTYLDQKKVLVPF